MDLPLDPRRYRDHADRGLTRDKVAAPDPAAAPLATDAEAGGARYRVSDATDAPGRARPASEARAAEHTKSTGVTPGFPIASIHRAPPQPTLWGFALAIGLLAALGVGLAVWGLS